MSRVSELLNKRLTISNPDRVWALLIGVGLSLSPIHNQRLTSWVTSEEGEVAFFLPAFGVAVWLIGSLAFIVWNWGRLDWGSKAVTVPLGIIVVAMAVSGASADSWGGRFAPALMGLSLFALYLAARTLGKDMFIPLAVGAGVASLGIILHQIIYPGEATGGFVFERNYDIATGYILLSASLLISHRRRWALALLALMALLLSGSAEAVFALGVLGVAVILRRDWGIKLVATVALVAMLVTALLVTSEGRDTHRLTAWATTGNPELLPSDRNPGGTALERRWSAVTSELDGVEPLGAGYNVTDFSALAMVHNVPLVIVQQLGWGGIVAGVAFLLVSVYCLVRTRWKYVWVLVLALCVWDHYIWTQLGPWWWAIVGASTASTETDITFQGGAA